MNMCCDVMYTFYTFIMWTVTMPREFPTSSYQLIHAKKFGYVAIYDQGCQIPCGKSAQSQRVVNAARNPT